MQIDEIVSKEINELVNSTVLKRFLSLIKKNIH